jgi:hypothetical protein
MPKSLNWLNGELEKIPAGKVKYSYRLVEKPFIIKEIPCFNIEHSAKRTLKDEKENVKFFQRVMPNNIPETSLVLAQNEEGKPSVYEIQERIEGKTLAEILKDEIDLKEPFIYYLLKQGENTDVYVILVKLINMEVILFGMKKWKNFFMLT